MAASAPVLESGSSGERRSVRQAQAFIALLEAEMADVQSQLARIEERVRLGRPGAHHHQIAVRARLNEVQRLLDALMVFRFLPPELPVADRARRRRCWAAAALSRPCPRCSRLSITRSRCSTGLASSYLNFASTAPRPGECRESRAACGCTGLHRPRLVAWRPSGWKSAS